ncbi:MAG: diacylglycerol kinase family protein [Acidimicrobiales bacterium]
MRFDVLVNDGAGSVGELDEERARIVEAFADRGHEAEVHVVSPADLPDAVRRCWAADPPPRAVVVAGGDGTVSCAAGAAAGTDVVLGVLPLGTFNHFAKDLGVPTDLGEAVAALVAGEVASVDVGEVNGRVFVNNSVLGLYPDLVAIRDELRDRHGWGKVRAVPVAAVHVLRRFPVRRLDLDGPGYRRVRVRTPLLFVGNGVFEADGAGPPTRTALADGALGVAVSRAVSRWGLVRSLVRGLARGSDAVDDVDQVALAALEVRVRARRVRVALDGEIDDLEVPLRYRARPGALRVLVPPPELRS